MVAPGQVNCAMVFGMLCCCYASWQDPLAAGWYSYRGYNRVCVVAIEDLLFNKSRRAGSVPLLPMYQISKAALKQQNRRWGACKACNPAAGLHVYKI